MALLLGRVVMGATVLKQWGNQLIWLIVYKLGLNAWTGLTEELVLKGNCVERHNTWKF